MSNSNNNTIISFVRRHDIELLFYGFLIFTVVFLTAAIFDEFAQDNQMLEKGCEPLAKNFYGVITAWKNCYEVS
jgi:hypothetical protein